MACLCYCRLLPTFKQSCTCSWGVVAHLQRTCTAEVVCWLAFVPVAYGDTSAGGMWQVNWSDAYCTACRVALPCRRVWSRQRAN